MGPCWYFWPCWDLFLEILCSLDFFGHILIEYPLRFSSSASSVQKYVIIVAYYSSLPMPSLSVQTLLMALSSSPESSEMAPDHHIRKNWIRVSKFRVSCKGNSHLFIYLVTIIPLQVLIVFHLLALVE